MRSAIRTASGASPSMTGMIGCSPGSRSKPSACSPCAEMPGIAVHALAQIRGALEQLEHPERRGRHGRRDAVGEQIRPGALAQPRDDLAARGHVAAAGAAERLAERAGEDVDAVHDAAQFVRAAAVRSHEAGRVRVVDHDEGAVLVGKIADRRELRERAVHRKDAVGGDQRTRAPAASLRHCSSSAISLFA